MLGAGIATEVVRTLNKPREVWDPDSRWAGYRFERSSQAFPDVRLVRPGDADPDIAIGVELKGWWLLSKEGVPSLRYQVAPAACARREAGPDAFIARAMRHEVLGIPVGHLLRLLDQVGQLWRP